MRAKVLGGVTEAGLEDLLAQANGRCHVNVAASILAGTGLAHGRHVLAGALPVVAVLALWSALVAEERRDPTDARPESDPERERWAELLVAVAVLDLASAVIHAAVTGEHFNESGLFGAFFLVAAAAQLAAAVWLVARRSQAAIVAIGAVNLGLVIIWVISRTVGVPVGPDPGVPEAIGAPDALSTAYEALIAVAAVAALARAPNLERPMRLVTSHLLPLLTAWVVAALTASALLLAR